VPSSQRVTVHKWAEVPAPAEQVWDLICDWAGMLRWWLPADQGGPQGPALIGHVRRLPPALHPLG